MMQHEAGGHARRIGRSRSLRAHARRSLPPWGRNAACRPIPSAQPPGGRPPRRHAEHSRCRSEFVTGAGRHARRRKPHAQADSAPLARCVRRAACAPWRAARPGGCYRRRMLHHVVTFKLKPDAPADQVERIGEAVHALGATLPEVRSVAIGRDLGAARGQRELCDRGPVRRCRRLQGLRRPPRARPHHHGADRPVHRVAQPRAVHGLTSRSSEPSGAPISAMSACVRKSPCSTTPVTDLTAAAMNARSAPAGSAQSRM